MPLSTWHKMELPCMLFQNVTLTLSQTWCWESKAGSPHLHLKNMLTIIQKDDSKSEQTVFLWLSCVFWVEEIRLFSSAAHVAVMNWHPKNISRQFHILLRAIRQIHSVSRHDTFISKSLTIYLQIITSIKNTSCTKITFIILYRQL